MDPDRKCDARCRHLVPRIVTGDFRVEGGSDAGAPLRGASRHTERTDCPVRRSSSTSTILARWPVGPLSDGCAASKLKECKP